MLRNANITQFFNVNINSSPHLETLLLATPSGKLLAHSSPLHTYDLRPQATIASQLWAEYLLVTRSRLLTASLPTTQSSPPEEKSNPACDEMKCITLQLEQGIIVIRQLKCLLLFVTIGPGPNRPQTASSITCINTTIASRDVTPTPSDPDASPPEITSSARNSSFESIEEESEGAGVESADAESSIRTSDTLSSTTAMNPGTSMAIVQNQSEELGKWLDQELANFKLMPSGS